MALIGFDDYRLDTSPATPPYLTDDIGGAETMRDENRSGSSSTQRSMRGSYRRTSTGPSQRDPVLAPVEANDPTEGLRAHAFQGTSAWLAPGGGTDVSLSGLEANERARRMIGSSQRAAIENLEATERAGGALEELELAGERRKIAQRMLPEEEEIGRMAQAGRRQIAAQAPRQAALDLERGELAQERAAYQFADEQRREAQRKGAWDEYGRQVAVLDRALEAYRKGGGQPPGAERPGISDAAHAYAKNQAYAELLAKLQSIDRIAYGALAKPGAIPGAQQAMPGPFQMAPTTAGPEAPTYQPDLPGEGG